MCGILGSITLWGEESSATPEQLMDLRDRMERRGPDDAGFFQDRNVALLHRRLAVRETGAAGAQPWTSRDGRWVVVYNGELYNADELRGELQRAGKAPEGFRTQCDTEVVAEAIAAFGAEAISKFRGMFAIGAFQLETREVLLARDPLGVKPLYWWCDGRELLFASDVRAIVEHPAVTPTPNLLGISAYLSTLRSTIDGLTLFEGVRMLEPGSRLACSTRADRLVPRIDRGADSAPVDGRISRQRAARELEEALEDSVRRQLVSDVPVCTLLSGGIDSATIAHFATRSHPELQSYAAGFPADDGDLEIAESIHAALGTDHRSEIVGRPRFLNDWKWMVEEGGLPLSTPNEVAIHAVAKRLSEEGCVVTLSGEGADEMLAGYEGVMRAAEVFEQSNPPGMCGGRFQLEASSWIAPAAKTRLFHDDVWSALEEDAFLCQSVREEFQRCESEVGSDATPLDAHLRFLRRTNLTALLERLDRSTMLTSVEGRVPFADAEVLRLCESFPMATKLAPAKLGDEPRTKLCLRDAMAGKLPEVVLKRPKASFPLPFQAWLKDAGREFAESPFAHAIFTRSAIEDVARDPAGQWSFAWPMMNIARWGDRWFMA